MNDATVKKAFAPNLLRVAGGELKLRVDGIEGALAAGSGPFFGETGLVAFVKAQVDETGLRTHP